MNNYFKSHIFKIIINIYIFSFLSLLCTTTVIAASNGNVLNIVIDDAGVAKDTDYPACSWKYCKKKAQKLNKHFLKEMVYKELQKNRRFKLTMIEQSALKDGLIIELRAFPDHGRGYAEFAAGVVGFGKLGVKTPYAFEVEYKILRNNEIATSGTHKFTEMRKLTTDSDTQNYKKSAAVKISKFASDFLDSTYYNPDYWKEFDDFKTMSATDWGYDRPGATYREFTIDRNSARECIKACLYDEQCKSWSMETAGPGKPSVCRLKNAAPAKKPAKNASSGTRLKPLK